MSEPHGNATKTVRQQYEDFPYPPREPQDESRRLLATYHEHLSLMNHYCFQGRQDFRHGFAALVAGGGTGDATIYLAQQLRETDARLTHLDLSEASMAIARRRADVRGLTNITWVRGSLLDLPAMGLGPFDYINCVGVLHHLQDPPAGLAALRAVLKDDGAMGLMVYAPYGRTGVYQMQEMLRLVNAGETDDATRLRNAKAFLQTLPETNWFRKGENLMLDHKEYGDSGVYDLLLHSTDRAYSIPQLYELLDSRGMNLVTFDHRQRCALVPGMVFGDKTVADILAPLPVRQQQAAMEIFCGGIIKHMFYASPAADTVASADHLDNVPFFHSVPNLGEVLYRELNTSLKRTQLSVDLPNGPRINLAVSRLTAWLFKHMDGKNSIRDLVQNIRRDASPKPDRDEVLAEFRRIYQPLNAWDVMLLRHSSAHPPAPISSDALLK